MKIFSRFRLLMLPTFEIDSALPKNGLIYEIGSGHGALAGYLALKPQRQVIGIDLDDQKTVQAKSHFQGKNLSFTTSDALKFPYQDNAGMVLSDLLHHLPFKKQEKLLRRLYQALKPGGVLVIKEADAGEVMRKFFHRIWDFILYPKDAIYYRKREHWEELLRSIGFEVKSQSAVLWFPGSTTIFVCRKLNTKTSF